MRSKDWLRDLRNVFVALLLAAPPLFAAPVGRLPGEVADALRAADVPVSAYAAVVIDANGRTLLSHNADAPMNPASVMKLVTTFAGLDRLGPAYVWRTEAYATGAVENGRLRGDLILKGGGDPGLTMEAFWMLLRDVRARGITAIDGDLVVDRSAFAIADEDPGRFDGEPTRPYNAGPEGLLLNHRSIRLTFVPDAAAQTVRILAEPALPEVTIANELVLGAGPCNGWPQKPEADLPGRRLTFRGTYPLACGEKVRHFLTLSPLEYTRALFGEVWRGLGGSFSGRIREAAVPADARLVTVAVSRPLADLVKDINKHSNNVMARQLFLTLGRVDGAPATLESARAVVTRWADERGLAAPELVLENGAGLSRAERISAGSLARLLRTAQESPVAPEFVASLPLAGNDGTLERWFQGSPVAGRAHLKTGYIEGVRGIAGYVHGEGGRTAVVVGLVNHPNAVSATAAQEALVRWALSMTNAGCCTGMRRADPQVPSKPPIPTR
jgi:D-alanyl-D-alanine carboxypeptidase/D-alanyl-D-alanine-endopeptidase (penicillin-binding protein 4)